MIEHTELQVEMIDVLHRRKVCDGYDNTVSLWHANYTRDDGSIRYNSTYYEHRSFWLVRVVTKHENIRTERTNSAPQTRDKFRCPKDSNCVEVTKIFLSSLSASNTFCDDNDSRRFSVPSSLLRLKLELNGDYKAKETVPSTRSRSAVRGSGGSSGPVVYYELLSGVRHRIALACRALDADIES